MKTKEGILIKILDISESMLMEDIVSIWSDELKAMEEYATQQCAAKDAEIDRLEVELENVRLYFSLTESEFDNIKIKNNAN